MYLSASVVDVSTRGAITSARPLLLPLPTTVHLSVVDPQANYRRKAIFRLKRTNKTKTRLAFRQIEANQPITFQDGSLLPQPWRTAAVPVVTPLNNADSYLNVVLCDSIKTTIVPRPFCKVKRGGRWGEMTGEKGVGGEEGRGKDIWLRGQNCTLPWMRRRLMEYVVRRLSAPRRHLLHHVEYSINLRRRRRRL